jgi:UDP:flavonoid glycosyltransferase YjiC (YdhE family)
LAAGELDVEVVVTVSPDDRHFLRDLPDRVRVAENLPLHVLLPTCAAVVHQGGAGTMLTAAACGVPQLVVPTLPDQLLNITQLSRTGAGSLLLRKGRPAAALRGEATGMLDALLADPAYRAAANGLRQEIAAQPPPSAAIAALAAL